MSAEPDLRKKLEAYSIEELCEIYCNLNSYKWDDRIGEKPEGFDELPKRRFKWWHTFTRKVTKEDIVEPYFYFVKSMIPEREISYYWNVVKHKTMSKKEFEIFWKKHQETFHSPRLWY